MYSAEVGQGPDDQQGFADDLVLGHGADGFSARINRNGAVIAQYEVAVFGYLVGEFDIGFPDFAALDVVFA